MKKILKLLLITCLCLTVSAAITACGNNSESEDKEGQEAGMANPLVESDEQGVYAATGIDLPSPAEAQNVRYFYIDMKDDKPIAEMRFTVDSRDYALRAQVTDITDFAVSDEEVGDLSAGKESESIKGDISGLYYDWETFSAMDVQYCDARCYGCKDAAFVAWVDVVPGILYNLSTTPGMDCSDLCNMASSVFSPIQVEN